MKQAVTTSTVQRSDEIIRSDYYHRVGKNIKEFVNISMLNGMDASGFRWIHAKNLKDLRNEGGMYGGIANLQRVNDIPMINKFFEQVNGLLQIGEYHIVCVETMVQRKKRILNKFPKPVAYPYYCLDFILKRVFPKLKPTRKICFWITGGRNRVLSLTEVLGRLVSCGFSIVSYKKFGYRTYIVTRKTGEPVYDMQPAYGLLCKLKRRGRGGKYITVYKIRTMHPYSEYLQEYVYEKNDLDNGGKIRNDFRVTKWGAWFRKFWIDELPMIWNWLKRDIKLVGVRPLSNHYYQLYPDDVIDLRSKVKPGLVPPYYADMPDGLGEIIASEKTYLKRYMEKPVRTDICYFCKVIYNIVWKGVRSH